MALGRRWGHAFADRPVEPASDAVRRPATVGFEAPSFEAPALDAYSLRLVTTRRLYDGGTLVSHAPSLAGLATASPKLRHLKLEDEPSPMKVSQVLALNPEVRIFGGLGGMMFLEELRHGAIGTMTGFAFPEILVRIHRAFAAGDIDGATEIFYKYCPLIRFENQPRINLALRKHIYHRRGVIATPRVEDEVGTVAELLAIVRCPKDKDAIPLHKAISKKKETKEETTKMETKTRRIGIGSPTTTSDPIRPWL